MMKNKRSLILLCIFFVLSSCKKTKEEKPVELPPITQTGAGTIGFMLGSEIWVPNTMFSTVPHYYTQYAEAEGKFILVFERISINKPSLVEHMTISLNKKNLSIGQHDLDASNSTIELSKYEKSGTLSEFVLEGKGILTLNRFDLNERIASGTFSFGAKEKTTNFIVKATSGRFDLKLIL
jgi:hypothetical protein